MIADYYYYNQLSADDKEVYEQLYNGILKHENTILIRPLIIKSFNFHEIFDAIIEDNPHLFYVNQRKMSVGQSEKGYDIFLNYYFDVDTCRSYSQKVQDYVNAIIKQSGALNESDEYDKVKKIYDLLISKGSYDFNDNLEDTRDIVYNHTVLGLLFEKKAVCEGIARTFKLILNAIDIKCLVVSGFAIRGNSQENHSWNIVKISDKSYHFDLTWAIENSQNNDINYDYFGLSDELIKRDHLGFKNVPKCISNDANYFERNGLVARKSSELDNIIIQKCHNPMDGFSVRLDYDCNISRTAKYVQKKIIERLTNESCLIQVTAGVREMQRIIHIKMSKVV